jgi:hypothetical protein
MNKPVLTILALLAFGSPGMAEDKLVVDMSKLTCRELIRADFQDCG